MDQGPHRRHDEAGLADTPYKRSVLKFSGVLFLCLFVLRSLLTDSQAQRIQTDKGVDLARRRDSRTWLDTRVTLAMSRS